jgi:hypothetical protein
MAWFIYLLSIGSDIPVPFLGRQVYCLLLSYETVELENLLGILEKKFSRESILIADSSLASLFAMNEKLGRSPDTCANPKSRTKHS